MRTTKGRFRYWNDEFKAWQKKFYNSEEWKEVRNAVRNREQMRCQMCGRFIHGKSIVDHIIEIEPNNRNRKSITLNPDNCQLLCIECHNRKTFGDIDVIDYILENRNDVNLF